MGTIRNIVMPMERYTANISRKMIFFLATTGGATFMLFKIILKELDTQLKNQRH